MHTFESKPAPTGETERPRYIMIGGFLGAGKTTAVSRLARYLTDQGRRVGLITNDQGRHLVDTAALRSQGFATEEITGGCFCCGFNSLVDAARRLTEASRPEVFIAEPVGSCTDLVATVTYPLRQLYGDRFTVAPVSVLVDPVRARRALGLERGASFAQEIIYIYLKQIEEADLVVISKCDLLDERGLEALRQAIAARFPRKEIYAVSAHDGTNLESWFARLTGAGQVARTAMEVDYQVYAEGEAMLGWLNCTVHLAAELAFDADQLLTRLAGEVQQRLQARKAEIAHLKMSLARRSELGGGIAGVNLVRNDFVPQPSFTLAGPVTDGQLIINLRAEAAPDVLGTVVREALAAVAKACPALQVTMDHLEQFRPGKPTPTHRLESLPA